MKKFRVHVNGQAYDVSVEELAPETKTAEAPAAKQAAAPQPEKTQPVAASAPVPEVKPCEPGPAGACNVCAPMPGVILNVQVNAGQTVKTGDVLLILEAMKMENEVTSPVSGTVKEISVNKGTNVNTGDLMVIIV